MTKDRTEQEIIETTLYHFGIQNSGEIAKAIVDNLNKGKHNWVQSKLSHGNYQCTKCLITDLEAKAIGMYEVCNA